MKYRAVLLITLLLAAGIRAGDSFRSTISDRSSYASAPAITYNNYTVLNIIGDWGVRGKYYQIPVRDAMLRQGKIARADYFISLGDNFYDSGVTSTNDSHWAESFENIYADPIFQKPWFIVLGNHDYLGSVQAEIDYSIMSDRWRLTARYHSQMLPLKDKGCALIAFLDTSPFVAKYQRQKKFQDLTGAHADEQLVWLKETLGKSTCKWSIVAGHHPIYSAGKKHGNTAELIDSLEPVLEDYKVDFYLAGHDHNLQHLKNGKNTQYLVSGSAAKSRPTAETEQAIFHSDYPGYLVLGLSHRGWFFEFRNFRNESLYAVVAGK